MYQGKKEPRERLCLLYEGRERKEKRKRKKHKYIKEGLGCQQTQITGEEMAMKWLAQKMQQITLQKGYTSIQGK